MANYLEVLSEKLSGEWHGITRTWFEPGKLADESPNHGTIRAVLADRFLLHEYSGSLLGEAFQGIALYGFDPQRDRFVASRVDSAHMGNSIMFSEGGSREDGFWVLGYYPDPQGGPPWGWRTEFELVAHDRLTIRADNIPSGGEKALAVETRYTRTDGRGQ